MTIIEMYLFTLCACPNFKLMQNKTLTRLKAKSMRPGKDPGADYKPG